MSSSAEKQKIHLLSRFGNDSNAGRRFTNFILWMKLGFSTLTVSKESSSIQVWQRWYCRGEIYEFHSTNETRIFNTCSKQREFFEERKCIVDEICNQFCDGSMRKNQNSSSTEMQRKKFYRIPCLRNSSWYQFLPIAGFWMLEISTGRESQNLTAFGHLYIHRQRRDMSFRNLGKWMGSDTRKEWFFQV